jgi:predicted homoserine dehydrogenase-like protein
MYDLIRRTLQTRTEPLDVVVVGLGFMGFGFLSHTRQTPGLRVPLVITRDVARSSAFLESKGFKVHHDENPERIRAYADMGAVGVSDNLDLIASYPNHVVFEVTGTIAYGTEAALRAVEAGKHLVTMNPELQVTVGSALKRKADAHGVLVTDVMGDQPGNLANLIHKTRLQGFDIRLAGNMKRFLDIRATQAKMKPWADDKGLSARQTTSFTDGTKQAIEMELVGNHFRMPVLQAGMQGPRIGVIDDVQSAFDWDAVPAGGAVDYAIGLDLFPGVFIVAEHADPEQTRYLRYLKLGDGPRYVLFEPYHLCHLEVTETIVKVACFGIDTIHNSTDPLLRTYAAAKFDLAADTALDGIGGDTVYGTIDSLAAAAAYLPIGLSEGAVLKRPVAQDAPVRLDDVVLPDHAATRLLGLV